MLYAIYFKCPALNLTNEQFEMGRLNAHVMETAGKAFYGGMEFACNGSSV